MCVCMCPSILFFFSHTCFALSLSLSLALSRSLSLARSLVPSLPPSLSLTHTYKQSDDMASDISRTTMHYPQTPLTGHFPQQCPLRGVPLLKRHQGLLIAHELKVSHRHTQTHTSTHTSPLTDSGARSGSVETCNRRVQEEREHLLQCRNMQQTV